MIRHIVMFTLTAADEAQREADATEARERLGALVGVIPGLQSITFKRDLGVVAGHKDAALISEHDDNAALELYQAHDAHLEVAAFVKSVTTPERSMVDYEV